MSLGSESGDVDPSHPDAGWAACSEPGIRVHPPAGMPLADGGILALAEDHAGHRYLVRIAPVSDSVRWTALRTDRMRDLTGISGEIPLENAPPGVPDLLGYALRSRHETDGGPAIGKSFVALSRDADPRLRAVFEDFLSTCGRATLPLLSVGEPLDWVRSLDRLAGVQAVDTALCRLPLLLPVLRALSYRFREQSHRDLASPLLDCDTRLEALAVAVRAADLRRRIPVTDAADLSLRRLLAGLEGVWLPSAASDAVLSLAPYAPPDWMPRDRESVEDMVRVTAMAVSLSMKSRGVLDVATLLAPVHGRWGRIAKALSVTGPTVTAGQFASDVRDMVLAFDRQALLPALTLAAHRNGTGYPVGGRTRDLATSWKVLFGGKGLLSVAQTLAHWHRKSAAMTGRVESLSPLGPRTWPRSYRDHVASNGLHVVEICSFDGLCREGTALSHCVATFAEGCSAGEFQILSVRESGGRSLSTAQVSPGGEVVQHRGAFNGEPGQADVTALGEAIPLARDAGRSGLSPYAWVVRRSGADLLARVRRWRARRWHPQHPYDPFDARKVDAAAAVWESYVPRPLRGGGLRLAEAAPAPQVGVRRPGDCPGAGPTRPA